MKTRFMKVRSRNTSTHMLDKTIEVKGMNVVYRAGSSTKSEEIFPKTLHKRPLLEINTAESCIISGDKIKMKEAFDAGEVVHAAWKYNDFTGWNQYPAIIKHIHSSQGNGIYYIENENDLNNWLSNHSANHHIIEKYYTYSKEYRIHINGDKCFHAVRKMLKEDAKERWHRHNNTCVCILPENPLFCKPANWDEIVAGAAKAMKAVGLTIGAVDVKIQTKGDNPKFIILETNSAPSLKEITLTKYMEELKNIINNGILL